MALKLNGKDNRLRRADFVKTAVTAGLSATAGNAAIDDMLARFAEALDKTILPDIFGLDQSLIASANKMRAICEERLSGFS